METVFHVTFKDGSDLNLPEMWEPVFADYAGQNPEHYPIIAKRLEFLVDKYMEHQAWPCKFDGIGMHKKGYENNDDRQLNEDGFYWLHWQHFVSEDDVPWREDKINMPPTHADLGHALLYYAMRSGIFQKILQDYKPEQTPLVISPDQIDLESRTSRTYLVTYNLLAEILFNI